MALKKIVSEVVVPNYRLYAVMPLFEAQDTFHHISDCTITYVPHLEKLEFISFCALSVALHG